MPLQHTKFDHTSKHRKRWINEHRSGVNAALPTSALSTPIKLLRVPGSNGIPAGSSAWGRMRSRIPFKVHPPSPNGAKPHSPGQAPSRRGATPWGKTPHQILISPKGAKYSWRGPENADPPISDFVLKGHHEFWRVLRPPGRALALGCGWECAAHSS
jgi:hypothetical protein